ncbi:MAG TPA: DNA replication and repair protein RecF [Solirubrobacteraceae bacterium]|nr:DNA replication and repair protein RecF [Solirubrobacteraceae bacterium]
MLVERIALREFRSYEKAELDVGPGLTIVHGANGAGKTNLLEGLYFGCTGRSFRTSNERHLVRHGAPAARVVVTGSDADGEHELAVGLEPGQAKRMTSDGAAVERLTDAPHRPLMSVFSPDRLELVKGQPGVRRAHLDQLVAALWPARAANRRAYNQALAQRNALLGRVRAGHVASSALAPWNTALAEAGVALAADRGEATARLTISFARHADELGLAGVAAVRYRSRSAQDPAALADELTARLDSDLARGYTTHGPHRDDLSLSRDGRDLRAFGSQGEQRLALLALLLAERDALAAERSRPPLLLLDDVMSELDTERRKRLADELRRDGQAVVTATEADAIPGWQIEDVTRISVP